MARRRSERREDLVGAAIHPSQPFSASLSGVLCVRHTMSTHRRQYAKASQEDAEGQRRYSQRNRSTFLEASPRLGAYALEQRNRSEFS